MSTRAEQYAAQVLRREEISPHLVRLTLGGEGLARFTSTGISDEWVGLVVPGQFQSRYYTVRSWDGVELVLDVVVHDVGLVTEWAMRDCTGETVTITEAKGSFAMPEESRWLYLVGDMTGLPAMARIVEELGPDVRAHVWAESPERIDGYFPEALEKSGDLTWLEPPGPGQSNLAAFTESLPWPEGPGYFWMAGESAQMRAIRKHLMREVKLPSTQYDVMGYWRAALKRQPRAVDPGPIYRAGKAAGKSDEEIWADYDAARETE
ncbi:siderophore-interacting protein [Nocardioides sp. Root140]|uniref:siderophore-interacting protein n=1 Tax=Nocardioides sp. Root140 TaxID=1736460 RepID=UPI0006F58F84|nr:siderophore-interacting protein [Nocardioides sp. Root140]KQY54602.1 siderophore synthetase [Nocardioides sp. Root140]